MTKGLLFVTGVALMVAGVAVRRATEARRLRRAELLAREQEYRRWVASHAVRNGRVVEEVAHV